MRALPRDGVDVHAHVLHPTHPTAPGARYGFTPGHDLDGWHAHLDALGLRRGVLVTASAYGADNRVLLDALGATDRAVGVAVVSEGVDDAELDRLAAAGVRGVRVQDLYPGGTPLTAIDHLGPRLAARGLHVEIWTDLACHLDWLPAAVRACPADVVVDHLGFLDPALPTDHPAVDALIDLARDGHAWVTLSGTYRHRTDLAPADAAALLAPRVDRLVAAVPDRLLWGSDWPFVGVDGATPASGELTAEVHARLPDEARRRQVLVDNPVAAYRL